MKYFHSWKAKINDLGKKGISVPPLQVDSTRLADSHVFRAPCSVETNEVSTNSWASVVRGGVQGATIAPLEKF